MSEGKGLYPTPTPSVFPLGDYHHLMRLIDVAGYNRKRRGFKLDEEARKDLREIDYHLFQENLPGYLDRSKRYDCMPGDPLNRLFAALPSPEQDDCGFTPRLPQAHAAHDRRVVLAIWPYANSSLERVVQTSSDPNAHDYWWLARFAFSLWDRSDLSIRCTFTQLLGQLATSGAVTVGPDPSIDFSEYYRVPGSYPTSTSDASTKSYNKQAWLRYARWIYKGRRDKDADIPSRKAAAKSNSIRQALELDKCSHCGKGRGEPPNNKMSHCSGCYVKWFPYIKRIYCSKECQAADWPENHYQDCQRRKHFLRAVYMLFTIVAKYQIATYSSFVSDVATESESEEGPADDPVRTYISPAAWGMGPWVGRPVFDERGTFLMKHKAGMVRRLLAGDSGDNLYYHLQHIIELVLGPHCDALVEMDVFIRNAGDWITSTSSDACRETDDLQVSKGKDPMFWPQPILSCRLKGSNPKRDVFVIDLACLRFGFEHLVLPFDVFVKTRHASCVGSRQLHDMAPHWSPRAQKGLITCRDLVAYRWGEYIKEYFAEHFPKYKIPGQLAKLKNDSFEKHAGEFMSMTSKALGEALAAIQGLGVHRQYLYHEPNPYAHEFTIGVTDDKEEVKLYENIWMTESEHSVIMGKISEQNKKLPVGSETRRLVGLWINRLMKHGLKHPFDAPRFLGPRLAKHYNIMGSFPWEECRAIETSWMQWNGITKEDVMRFYSICDRVMGRITKKGPVTPELLSNLIKSKGGFDWTKNLTAEEGQIFLTIGTFIAAQNSPGYMKELMPPRLPQQAARALRRLATPSTPITRYLSTSTPYLAAPSAAPAGSSLSRMPADYVPVTKPPSARPPETRKSQLIRTYTSLLRTTPLVLFFQHSNLTADEWSAVRRELNTALEAATPEGSPLSGREVHLQVLRTRMFNVALKLAEFYNPEVAKANPNTPTGPKGPLVHDLSMAAYEAMKNLEVPEDSAYAQISPLLCGPTAALVFPAVSPAHLAAALKVLSPSGPKFPAPTRKKNPSYYDPLCQAGLQKLLLVGGRIEGDVFDVEGVKWVGGIEGGIDGLRAQLVHLLQNAGLGLTSALEAGSKSLWLTLEGRKTMLEDEGKEGEGEKKSE
ncbi:mitochondrial 54S ribosomal uL10m domain-containing protein [Colletotrichum truncatum]|uniref:Mynd finger n=1 Tax=Colletotrichum truncatum TaxID=5467 RepID=A0ACC3YVG7_COLTU|nr:mynd finger [Colletotrichum truncatum]KAF6781549.1 mynd finger [Colletotrichum truncatum]